MTMNRMISTDVEGANQLNSTNASKIVRSAMDKYNQAVVGIRSVLKFYSCIVIFMRYDPVECAPWQRPVIQHSPPLQALLDD